MLKGLLSQSPGGAAVQALGEVGRRTGGPWAEVRGLQGGAGPILVHRSSLLGFRGCYCQDPGGRNSSGCPSLGRGWGWLCGKPWPCRARGQKCPSSGHKPDGPMWPECKVGEKVQDAPTQSKTGAWLVLSGPGPDLGHDSPTSSPLALTPDLLTATPAPWHPCAPKA